MAQDVDFTGQIHYSLPYAIAFVLVLAFRTLASLDLKQAGVGLAVAVRIDAT